MDVAKRIFTGIALSAALAACGGSGYRGPNAALEHNVAIGLLTQYDSNTDGILSRTEFESALRTDFATLDGSADGFLDRDEVASENDRRWQQSGTAATPLIDWNADGSMDFNEFSASQRATFTQLDTNSDDALSTAELAVMEDQGPPRQGDPLGWPESPQGAPAGG